MISHSLRWACALLISLQSSGFAMAQDSSSDKPADSEPALILPPAPVKENLLPFYVSPIASLTFAIDAKSLTLTEDGIFRYTIVITSASGASNISHEGIRCSTLEKKLYATARADGSWTPASQNAWSQIRDVGANRYQAALARDFFCEGTVVSARAPVILERIRRGKTLR